MLHPRFWSVVGLLSPWLSLAAPPALAQLIPDTALGVESSTLTPGVEVRGGLADWVEGGARRGSNLFHSFLEFNIDPSQRLYFANPAGVESILTRITGRNPSNIFGTLGVDGAADLFLINPNGIVFGETASLDIQGSFYASTAEAIPLGNGVYSATQPTQSRLLTVNPSALFSSYLTEASGNIQNRGLLAAQGNMTLAAHNLDLQGQVAAGGDLTLLGLDTVQIRDGADAPFIGFAGGDLLVQGHEQVDIVALSHPDSGLYSYGDMVLRSSNPVGGDAHYWSGGSFRVETLDTSLGELFSPIDPVIRALGDVELFSYLGGSLHILAGGSVNIGTAIITDADPGEIGVDFLRETITLADGTVVAIDGGAQPTLDVRAGVNPSVLGTAPLEILTGFDPATDTFFGDAFVTDAPSGADITVGDIFLDAPNGLVLLTTSYQPNTSLAEGSIFLTGDGLGSIGIDARGFGTQGGAVYLDARENVVVTNSAILTIGTGSVGDVVINAGDTVRFEQQTRLTGVASSLTTGARGTGGDIRITAANVALIGGAQLSASTAGQGNAGNVDITARDTVVFDSTSVDGQAVSAAFSSVESGAVGRGGNVVIRTGSLTVTNGAQLQANTAGRGNAGNVEITARDRVVFDNSSAAFSRVEARGRGSGGNVIIEAHTLEVLNSSQLSASTSGNGNAGNVEITAHDRVVFDGSRLVVEGSTEQLLSSAAFSRVDERGRGSGGNVVIEANTVEVLNGAQLSTSALGNGDAGNVEITARDRVLFAGISADGQVGSTALSRVGGESTGAATGTGGNVIIEANTLEMLDAAQLSASTFGNGDAGDVEITVRDRAIFDNVSAVFSSIEPGAVGTGGNVVIEAHTLEMRNDSQLIASSRGNGDAGNVDITVRDLAMFSNGSAAFSALEAGARGTGGNVVIEASRVALINGGQLQSRSRGFGNAGQVMITARDSVFFQGVDRDSGLPSGIFADNTELSTGQGNDIQITAPQLLVRDGAVIVATTRNNQPGGNLILNLGRLEILDGGQVVTSSLGRGPAGTVRVDAAEGIRIEGSDPNFANRVENTPGTAFFAVPQSTISVQSTGEGAAGNIIIGDLGTTPWLELSDDGQMIAESASVDGGNVVITLNERLLLRNGSLISTTAGTAQAGGNGGNITLSVPFIVAIREENSDIAADAFAGAGGNVTINARGIFGIEPRPQRTPLSDITASSELGISGVVTLNTLDTSSIENSLASLDDTLIDTAALTTGSCIARPNQSLGSFTVTGRGGLPQRPGDRVISAYPTGTVRAIADPTDALPEPDGVYQLPDGRLVLSRACD